MSQFGALEAPSSDPDNEYVDADSPSTSSSNSPISSIYAGLGTQNMVTKFKKYIYFDKENLINRYTILISRLCSPNEPTTLEGTLISLRLAQEMKRLPSVLWETGTLSRRIRSMCDRVLNMIYDSAGYTMVEESQADLYPEICAFCNDRIPLKSLDWAECAAGHKFRKCFLY